MPPAPVSLAIQNSADKGKEKKMNTADFIKYWIDANENGTDEMSYGDLAELTHDTQVAIFGFCGCEDNGNDNNESPYGDCPKNSSSFVIRAA